MRFHRLAIGLIGVAMLAGCQEASGGTIDVSVVDASSDSPNRQNGSGALKLAVQGASGLGLLRFDQTGQLVAGVAVRWAIVDGGSDGIFRIDTSAAPAPLVAHRLRELLARPDRRLFAYGTERVAAVTEAVVEIRLTEPRSDLLTWLAAPEMAGLVPDGGSLRVAERNEAEALLVPRTSASNDAVPIHVRGEHAGAAVARFAAGRSALVLGGTFDDLPVARAAGSVTRRLRYDHPTGLFGLAPRADVDPDILRAIDLAIDRDRLLTLIGAPGQVKATTIGGSQLEPPRAQRLAQARLLMRNRSVKLRLSVPRGAGGTSLFRSIAYDMGQIGIAAERVLPGAATDLLLVDQVVPQGDAPRAACIAAAGCDPADKRALLAPAFIPLSTPLRWSLVSPELDLFTENALAVHPLDRLRTRHRPEPARP